MPDVNLTIMFVNSCRKDTQSIVAPYPNINVVQLSFICNLCLVHRVLENLN